MGDDPTRAQPSYVVTLLHKHRAAKHRMVSTHPGTANPQHAHWKALIKVLQYAYNTRTQGITIRPSADFYKASLLHFTDASYQSDPITGRSISGHFTMVDRERVRMRAKV